jgi:hypothetical protein
MSVPKFSGGLAMFSKVLDTLFGCWHSRYSFPMTIRTTSRRSATSARVGTYVVCLDCGKELPYDWQRMRLLDPRRKESTVKEPAPSLVTKEAA